MNSKIYTGHIYHKRFEKSIHEFKYPVYFYAFDLGELENLDKTNKWFGYNRFALASLYDKDYLYESPDVLRTKVLECLKKEGVNEEVTRVELVTTARFLGYVFNPASFYYCYNVQNKIVARVAEVTNTFTEKHVYVLPGQGVDEQEKLARYFTPKQFHVSPFFDRTGEYEFRFSQITEAIDIHVNLKKEGEYALVSRMWGRGRDLTSWNLFKTTLSYPLMVFLTLPRIHFHAFKLYFQKKVMAYKKPPPLNEKTIRIAKPKLKHKLAMYFAYKFLNKISKGTLSLKLPDGEIRKFGELDGELRAEVHVHHYDFFWRIIKDQGIGLGEGYMEQDWSSPDLRAFLNLLIENKPYFATKVSFFNTLGDWWNRWYHIKRKNTILGSKKNIEDHYDLSNEMYQLFLDKSMSYSCGIYENDSDDLYDSQQNKLASILEKAKINASDHVLEIGCGWGALAIKGVQETGCKWTGLTLSKEQLELANERVKEAGLEEKIDLKICDYRKVEGKFDRIVSVEMLEAVGEEYLGEFFQVCDRLLKPDGIAVIQVITIPDQRYKSYARGCDWIQKHIFPGGHLPSLSVLCDKMTRFSNLYIEDVENIGVHYARTLADWRKNFLNNQEQVKALGFSEKFIRKWDYYLSYCEAGFGKRYLNDLHLVLTRTGNKNLDNSSVIARSEATKQSHSGIAAARGDVASQ